MLTLYAAHVLGLSRSLDNSVGVRAEQRGEGKYELVVCDKLGGESAFIVTPVLEFAP